MASSSKCGLLALVVAVCLLAGVSEGARRQLASSPSSSWQSYWDAKLPGVQAPAIFSQWSSKMSAAVTAKYVNELQSGQVSGTTNLCKEGKFLCVPDPGAKPGCTISLSYSYGCGAPPTSGSDSDAAMLLSQVFFRPEELSAGNKFVYPKLANDLQGRTFLPAELSKAMPFNPEKLPSYLALLGDVPTGSDMAADMEETLAFCNSKPLAGEIVSCHSSIESMVEFSVSNMGPNLAVFLPAYAASQSEEVRVSKDPVTLSSPEKKVITCHDHMYPYLVYLCHVVGSSQIMDVELQREADGSSFHGISVCHTDTSSWSTTHPAFAALNAKPGDGAICHWTPENNIVWVHA